MWQMSQKIHPPRELPMRSWKLICCYFIRVNPTEEKYMNIANLTLKILHNMWQLTIEHIVVHISLYKWIIGRQKTV